MLLSVQNQRDRRLPPPLKICARVRLLQLEAFQKCYLHSAVLSKVISVPFLSREPWQKTQHYKTTHAHSLEDPCSSTNNLPDPQDWGDHFWLWAKAYLARVNIANICPGASPAQAGAYKCYSVYCRSRLCMKLQNYQILPATIQTIITAEKLKITYFKVSWILGGRWDKLVSSRPGSRKDNHATAYCIAPNPSVSIIFSYNRESQERGFSSQQLRA